MLRRILFTLGIMCSVLVFYGARNGYDPKDIQRARRDTPAERKEELQRAPRDTVLRRLVLEDLLQEKEITGALREWKILISDREGGAEDLFPHALALYRNGANILEILPARFPALLEWAKGFDRLPELRNYLDSQFNNKRSEWSRSLGGVFEKALQKKSPEKKDDSFEILEFCLLSWMKDCWKNCEDVLQKDKRLEEFFPTWVFVQAAEIPLFSALRPHDRFPEKSSLFAFDWEGELRFSEESFSLGWATTEMQDASEIFLLIPLAHSERDSLNEEFSFQFYGSKDNKRFNELLTKIAFLRMTPTKTLILVQGTAEKPFQFWKLHFPKLSASFAHSSRMPARLFMRRSIHS